MPRDPDRPPSRNAMGLPLTPGIVMRAYALGAFPMADGRSGDLHWISPDPRAIFPISADDPAGAFHTPRSLAKLLRRRPFTLRLDTDFPAVIAGCAEPRPDDPDTWISPAIQDVFTQLHTLGQAHCVAAYQNDHLVGGLYGLVLGGAFFAESMFSRVPNASKACLVYLVDHLRQRGFSLLDVQFTNPHLEQFGVAEIPHEDYMARLHRARKQDVCFIG